MEVTVFTLEDGNYCVLDKITYQDKTYLYLFKEDEPEVTLIQEYEKDSKNLKSVSEETFNILLQEFAKRHVK